MAYGDWTRDQLIRELTARDAAEIASAKTRRSINLLETIHLAQTDFLTVDSKKNIFHKMLENFLAVTGCEYGFIHELFCDEDGRKYLEARAITNIAWDDASRVLYEKLVSGEVKFDNMKSLYGVALVSGEPIIANDAPNDPRRAGIPPGHPPLNSFMGIPMFAADEYVGMIGLANAPGGFDQSLIEHLAPLTKICAIMMRSLKIDRRRAEAIIRLQHVANDLASSNEELEKFAYVCSHDLQAPLRHISAFTTLLTDKLGEHEDPEVRAWMQMVGGATRRMQRLIIDLLAYARVGELQRPQQDVDLNRLVDRVLETLSEVITAADGHVRRDELPRLTCHRTQVAQLFQNLIENALRYRAAGVEPRIEVRHRRDDGVDVFSVSDNGIGIDAIYHQRIFQIFQRLDGDRDSRGTGIGLAICQRVVAMHDGRIWVDSRPGAGSTFSFTLAPSPRSEIDTGDAR